MHLLRLVATHPMVIGHMETAARTSRWAKFQMHMQDLDVDCVLLPDPFAAMLSMAGDKMLKFSAFMLVMHVCDSGIAWGAKLNELSDYKRVGLHSTAWGFSIDGHKRMVEAGFNVAKCS